MYFDDPAPGLWRDRRRAAGGADRAGGPVRLAARLSRHPLSRGGGAPTPRARCSEAGKTGPAKRVSPAQSHSRATNRPEDGCLPPAAPSSCAPSPASLLLSEKYLCLRRRRADIARRRFTSLRGRCLARCEQDGAAHGGQARLHHRRREAPAGPDPAGAGRMLHPCRRVRLGRILPRRPCRPAGRLHHRRHRPARDQRARPARDDRPAAGPPFRSSSCRRNGNVPHAVRAGRLGVVDFIEKPFRVDQLIAAVEKGFELLRKPAACRGSRRWRP